MNITETIVHLAAPYTAVAFDVFDTLLKRDVAQPTDLFLLQGKTFADCRVRAEAKARAAVQGEVTLAEIYTDPALSGYDPAQECALELAAVLPNYPVWRAVQILRSQGKRVYFISDMYLPTEQIAAMLAKCGYEPFDGGFVSCSYGVQKRSGALFRRFLHETELKACQVLFVGDSWRADVVGAALAGIRAWHLPSPKGQSRFPRTGEPVLGAIEAFIQNRLAGCANEGEKLGFATLGPLLVAFCHWLHDRRSEQKSGRLFFLARDMYLARQIYALLYPEEETFYLQVSRQSLCPALLKRQEYSLLATALPRQKLTGKQIAAYCGAACPESSSHTKFNLKDSSCTDDLLGFLQELTPPETACLAEAYLQQSGLKSGDILVDIGSGGTTQILLERLCGVKLHGLQLSGDERLRSRLSQKQAEVFLSLQKEEKSLYWAAQPMLERMISQDCGATIGYIRKGNSVEVQVDSCVPSSLVAQLQSGAVSFARDWNKSVLAHSVIPPASALTLFLLLFRSPTVRQASLLGNLSVDDGAVYPLAPSSSMGYYLLHPTTAARDFSASRWKIGFLKRTVRLPLPYDRLYLAMKK